VKRSCGLPVAGIVWVPAHRLRFGAKHTGVSSQYSPFPNGAFAPGQSMAPPVLLTLVPNASVAGIAVRVLDLSCRPRLLPINPGRLSMTRRGVLSLTAVLAIGACSDQQDSSPTAPAEAPSVALSKKQTPSYVISFSAKEAGDIRAVIKGAGGTVGFLSKRAGLATVESADPAFASKLGAKRGIRAVALDTVVQWVDPKERVQQASIGTNETFFAAQWAPRSIHAEEAWDDGARGTGARVAVLDGGLNNTHVELNNSVDVANSRSFVPGFQFNQDAPCGAASCFSHATHVAGIVAAEDDDAGTIGVAPGATIIGVKVLHGGSGSFGAVISGIVYAATPTGDTEEPGAGAHIINMSLGVTVPSGRDINIRALKAALDQATTFAHEQGVLVVAAAGNGDKHGRGIDHDLGQWFTLPAESDHVVAVSALGPVGFALGATNFDRLASYSNFGASFIDLSGPGGDGVLPGNAVCTVGVITVPCFAFDFVLSPGSLGSNTGYSFAAGTSQAAPAVAGVAALVIGTKGPMDADDLLAVLVNSADDLGAPGVDPVHGNGWVYAFLAVQ
jgi:subtilisin family serine protease